MRFFHEEISDPSSRNLSGSFQVWSGTWQNYSAHTWIRVGEQGKICNVASIPSATADPSDNDGHPSFPRDQNRNGRVKQLRNFISFS